MAYRLTPHGSVTRLADNADIPPDPDNADWQAYQIWLAEGGQPDPAPAPPAPVPRMIAKTTIYRRATDAEIAAFLGFLERVATPRQRLMWEDAEGGLVYVDDVIPLARSLFGADRAAEMLA